MICLLGKSDKRIIKSPFSVLSMEKGDFYLFFGFGAGTASHRSQRICFALASIFRAVLRISSPHSSAVCRPVSLRVNR